MIARSGAPKVTQARGEAHAISPDAPFRHPAFRSLHAGLLRHPACASPARPSRLAWASPLAVHRWSCS